ncbi:MAG: prolyl oligopeptidase family serine peptidase [Kangiellaceae bacterium]|nr:prolyl oligopeptidase family serine peptidase [Kangiellaceae bacterium]
MFIVHSGKDRRAPPEQAYLLKEALENRNMPFEWLFKRSEGHGFSNENNRIDFYHRTLEFLSKHL